MVASTSSVEEEETSSGYADGEGGFDTDNNIISNGDNIRDDIVIGASPCHVIM